MQLVIFIGVGWGITPHNGRQPLAKVIQFARYLFLQGVPLSDMSLSRRQPFIGGPPLWKMTFYPEMSLFEITVVPLNEGGPFVEGSPKCEVTLQRRCPFMGSASFWELPLYEKCPFMEGAPLWDVPSYRSHPFMKIHGRCTFMRDALMGCAPLWKVPFYEKYSLVGTELHLFWR